MENKKLCKFYTVILLAMKFCLQNTQHGLLWETRKLKSDTEQADLSLKMHRHKVRTECSLPQNIEPDLNLMCFKQEISDRNKKLFQTVQHLGIYSPPSLLPQTFMPAPHLYRILWGWWGEIVNMMWIMGTKLFRKKKWKNYWTVNNLGSYWTTF